MILYISNKQSFPWTGACLSQHSKFTSALSFQNKEIRFHHCPNMRCSFQIIILSTGIWIVAGQCHGGLFLYFPCSSHQAAAEIASPFSLDQFCSFAFKICPPNICVDSSLQMLQFFAIFCHHPNILCELMAPHWPSLHCIARWRSCQTSSSPSTWRTSCICHRHRWTWNEGLGRIFWKEQSGPLGATSCCKSGSRTSSALWPYFSEL